MDRNFLGILVGGILPAFIYALSGTLQKVPAKAGVGVGPYLALLGLGVTAVGLLACFFFPRGTLSFEGLGSSAAVGIIWGLGTGAVLWALGSTGVPIAKLVPLYNMNTLFAVILGLIVFSEAKQLQLTPLLIGTVLIAAGSVLVSRS